MITKKMVVPLLLCGTGVMLIFFNLCDGCAHLDANGMVHDNIFCCLGPPLMVFLGAIWLVVLLVLKIIGWIKQLHQNRKR